MVGKNTEKLPESFNGKKLNEIIEFLLQKTKLSLTQLHRNTGVPIPTIKRLQSDPAANPTISSLLPIAKFFGITVNQLVGSETLPDDIGYFFENKDRWKKVPILNWITAVSWCSDDKKASVLGYVRSDVDVSEHAFALILTEQEVVGFLPGSILIVEPSVIAEHKDYIILCKMGQEKATLRQYLVNDGTFFIKSLDPTFAESQFQITRFDNNHKILGVIVQVRNDMKK